MKMYKKEDLSFVNGYLVDKENNIVPLHINVVAQLNTLETMYQQAKYWAEQPAPEPVKPRSLANFKRESAFEVPYEAKHETPLLDQKIEESMRLVNEIKGDAIADNINERYQDFAELIQWADADFVVEGMNSGRIDTPNIGNPLELTGPRVCSIIASITGLMNDADIRFLDDMVPYEVVEPDKGLMNLLGEILGPLDCDNCDETDCEKHPDHEQSDGESE